MSRATGISLIFCAVTAIGSPAGAQLITIRTIPLAQEDQFILFPSQNLAMGGVSIALADTTGDPFRNPATGSRLSAGRFFGAPFVYSVSQRAGAGRTLPLGAFVRRGNWFGGLAAAIQQVDDGTQPQCCIFFGPQPFSGPVIVPQPIQVPNGSHGNTFAVASLGTVLPGGRTSLGGSVSAAWLNAVDGVDMLYGGSTGVVQSGSSMDLRLGMLKEWQSGRTFQAVALHNRYDMTHTVTWPEFFWDPATQTIISQPRIEANPDRTNTWGLHAEFAQPLRDGWRVGGILTANRMSHPKIPNYVLMSIPRDPGHSNAFNVGVGISKVRDGMRFAMDAVYEPISSHTWADTDVPVPVAGGGTIPVGGRTIQNRFRFHNVLLRVGMGQETPFSPERFLGFDLGISLRAIRYRLDQQNHVDLTSRRQVEQWVEWTPSWGLSLRLPAVTVRYQGRVIKGTGRPGVFNDGGAVPVTSSAGGIVIAPSGPLALGDVSITTHRISMSFPLR